MLHYERHHFDNNLPPYQSKIARLNVECSDPTLQQDCVAGQKWKCINDDGRWRKHKCKFHKEVQDHLAEINKYLTAQQTRRNCACFTPNGVVYTKIKSERDIFHQKQKRFDPNHRNRNNGRYKREVEGEIDEIYHDKLPTEFVNLLRMDEVLDNLQNKIFEDDDEVEKPEHSRKKRETDYITQTIDELHSVLLTLEKKYLNTTKGPVQCFVETTGKVNCSTIVYENEKAWKQSRLQIDMLIKVLKDKIGNLKDIKKHLKENRPANMTTYDEELYESFNTSAEEHSEERTTTTKAPHHHHQHRHHQNGERRRKQKHTSTSTSTTEEIMATSENDEISSSSVTQDSLLEEISSTIKAIKSSSLRPRNRTRIFKSTTTIPVVTTSEDTISSSSFTDDFSSTSEFPSDLISTSQIANSDIDIPLTLSTTEQVITTTNKQKHHHPTFKQQIYGNSVNQLMNITSSNGNNENKSTLPAECYCEPEFEG